MAKSMPVTGELNSRQGWSNVKTFRDQSKIPLRCSSPKSRYRLLYPTHLSLFQLETRPSL